MNRLLIRSDHITIRSDEHPGSFGNSSAQTPPQLGARFAPARAAATRFADRDLQALWSTKLSLRRRSGTRPKAISGHQSARRAAAQRLRPERSARARGQFDRQLQEVARDYQRNLCDQHGTPTPAREPWIARDRFGSHYLRRRQSRRRSRRHGCLLSCSWRLTIKSGERQ